MWQKSGYQVRVDISRAASARHAEHTREAELDVEVAVLDIGDLGNHEGCAQRSLRKEKRGGHTHGGRGQRMLGELGLAVVVEGSIDKAIAVGSVGRCVE